MLDEGFGGFVYAAIVKNECQNKGDLLGDCLKTTLVIAPSTRMAAIAVKVPVGRLQSRRLLTSALSPSAL